MSRRVWTRLQWLLFVGGGVPVLIVLLLVWLRPTALEGSAALRWTLSVLAIVSWLGCGLAVRERLVERLRTFGNILAAVREGDYTVRASGGRGDDPLAEIARELNALGGELKERRLSGREAGALLAKVLEEIDAGIFTFDADARLQLVNRRGAAWLGRPPARLIGVSARALGLAECLSGETPRVVDMAMPLGTGRFEIRRTGFRESGRAHTLLVVSDLSRALAAEERLAWRRLVQVLRHEINNSLAPIQSMGSTLRDKLTREPRPPRLDEDLAEGLDVIVSRSESLARLMAAYAKLTKLPPPEPKEIQVAEWVESVATLEHRLPVQVTGGPRMALRADPAQLEQALINLVRNAVDAVLETGGAVRVGWGLDADDPDFVTVTVEDDGPGLSDSENLFVPFFTTKPAGTGIGLVLSRQIVEGHGGRLTLSNRGGGRGCLVSLRLPIRGPSPSPTP